MKVVTIGTDRKLFDEHSAVRARVLEYARRVEEMHVIVMSSKSHGLSEVHVGNLHIYPTHSLNKFFYIRDAYGLGCDVIHEHAHPANTVISTQDPFETGWVGYKLSQKFKLPLQLQVHTDFLSVHFKRGILNRIRVWMAKRIIPKARGIRVVSESVKLSLVAAFPTLETRIDVLPIYVDVEALMHAFPEKDIRTEYSRFSHIVLMASRLTKEKRIDVAMAAFKKVLQDNPNALLLIAGNGPERKHLRVCGEYNGIVENMVFVGWQRDLIPFYKAADVFLLSSEYEGYGMTLIEAAACGCPIVTTEVGIARSAVFKNGWNAFVCPVGDEGCLAQSLISVLNNPSQRELFKTRMQDSIKQALSREEYVAEYIGLLEKLLTERP